MTVIEVTSDASTTRITLETLVGLMAAITAVANMLQILLQEAIRRSQAPKAREEIAKTTAEKVAVHAEQVAAAVASSVASDSVDRSAVTPREGRAIAKDGTP